MYKAGSRWREQKHIHPVLLPGSTAVSEVPRGPRSFFVQHPRPPTLITVLSALWRPHKYSVIGGTKSILSFGQTAYLRCGAFILGNHQETGKLQQQAEKGQARDLGLGGGGLEGCKAHHRGSLFPSVPPCSHTAPHEGLRPSWTPTCSPEKQDKNTEKLKDSWHPFSSPSQVSWTVA